MCEREDTEYFYAAKLREHHLCRTFKYTSTVCEALRQ